MAKKKLKKQEGTGFIPGIYNYCDRWCEKCGFQLQCVSFVMGKKMEEKGGFDWDDDEIWKRLKNVFESTYEILQELAEERGIKVEDIYVSEQIDRGFWEREFGSVFKDDGTFLEPEGSDILGICRIYEHWADRCLEKVLNSEKRDERLDEDLEIISWYLDLVQAKMQCALRSRALCKKTGRCRSDEYNGSAKVALLSIEASMESWKRIRTRCAEFSEEITHLMVMLEQLKGDIECRFPEAREFQRPGFERHIG